MSPKKINYEEDENEDTSQDEKEDNLIPLNIPPEYQNIMVDKFDMSVIIYLTRINIHVILFS